MHYPKDTIKHKTQCYKALLWDLVTRFLIKLNKLKWIGFLFNASLWDKRNRHNKYISLLWQTPKVGTYYQPRSFGNSCYNLFSPYPKVVVVVVGVVVVVAT